MYQLFVYRALGQPRKPNCGVDVVAQKILPQRDLCGEKALHRVTEKALAKRSIASNACLYGLSEVSCQGHFLFLFSPLPCDPGPSSDCAFI